LAIKSNGKATDVNFIAIKFEIMRPNPHPTEYFETVTPFYF